MGSSNIIVNTLLKSIMPTVKKFVESGKIDDLFRELKSRYKDSLRDQENSVEIMITTEQDGLEYVSVVEMTGDLRIERVMFQQRLSGLVTTLFTQAEI